MWDYYDKMWAYNDWDDNNKPIVRYFTDTEIMNSFWKYWSAQMLKRGGLSPMITKENCIEDWVVVNWAWPVND